MNNTIVRKANINAETVRLFNAICVENKRTFKITEDKLVRCVENGYFLSENIEPTNEVLSAIEANIGISGEQANKTLHKSWKTVSDTPIEVLVAQQIFHYITTYGFESLGVYSEDTIYIPAENLEIPEIEEYKGLSLVYISAITEEELYSKVMDLASSGVALSSQSVNDMFAIISTLGWSDSSLIDDTKNRELKSKLYDYFGVAPSNPEDFVRYAVQKLTGETLVIKNKKLVNLIKESDSAEIKKLISAAPKDLASVFYRFKPIFLAMKSAAPYDERHFFNRLRKDAVKLHKPMKEDYLNSITSRIKNGESLDGLEKTLASANVFRKIRLLNALTMREEGSSKAVYSVRNGSGWVEDRFWPKGKKTIVRSVVKSVFASIVSDVQKNVEGKTFYIPEGIRYTAPATEKQFTGNIPFGSSVSVTGDMIVGIYWEDNKDRIDLDLSFINMSGSKTGWDGFYINEDMLFSGDITAAPNGASESFYVKGKNVNGIFMVNHFNRGQNSENVQAKIFVGQDELNNNHSRYTMNPNNLVLSSNFEIENNQTAIAIMKKNTVYFVGRNIGSGISARGDLVDSTRDFYVKSLEKMVTLEQILNAAGAKVVHSLDEEFDVNLSFGNVDKSTFINILS